MNRHLPLLAVGVFMVVAVVFLYFDGQERTGRGGDVFQQAGCVKCHVFGGIGLGTIDLTEVTKRHSDDWIHEQIIRPSSHNPNTGMPSFAHLPEKDIASLIKYFHSRN